MPYLTMLWAELCFPKILWSPSPYYLRMWLYLEIGFFKDKVKWGHVGRPESNRTAVLLRTGDQDPHSTEWGTTTWRHSDSIAYLQAKERDLKRTHTCQHLHLGLPASSAAKIHFCRLSRPECGTLLWQPQQTNARAESFFRRKIGTDVGSVFLHKCNHHMKTCFFVHKRVNFNAAKKISDVCMRNRPY